MTLVERVLMGPGPSNPYPEATAALAAPMLGHLAGKVRSPLVERFSIESGGGAGAGVATIWRIGWMGHTAGPANVTLLLAALAEVPGR